MTADGRPAGDVRLNLLRAADVVLVVGLGIIIWPTILATSPA